MNKQLKTIESGETFNFGGYDWTKLDDDFYGGTLVMTNDIIFKKAFDEDNCNDWRESSLRSDLNDKNNEFFKTIFENESLPFGQDWDEYFLTILSDLTADDGMKNYETSSDYVALLTCDLYRKYRDIIPPADDYYWTMTPWTCDASYSRYVRLVNSTGTLYHSYASYGNSGVRPLCRLKSEISVSVKGDDLTAHLPDNSDYKRGYKDGFAAALEKMADFIGEQEYDLENCEDEE